MSESKHTPGPWVIDPEYPSEVQTAGLLTVASCWHAQVEGLRVNLIGVLPCSLEESAANARLIAAAPDLLAACKCALGHLTGNLDGDWDISADPVALLRAALSSAAPMEGERS